MSGTSPYEVGGDTDLTEDGQFGMGGIFCLTNIGTNDDTEATPDDIPPGNPEGDGLDPIPIECYHSIEQVDTHWKSRMSNFAVREPLTTMPHSYDELTQAQRDTLDSLITHGEYDSRYYQTERFHHSMCNPTAELSAQFTDAKKWKPNPSVRPVVTSSLIPWTSLPPVASRMAWTLAPGATPGGSGGQATLPVDYQSSPWRMPEVNIENFRLGPLLNAGFLPGRRPGDVGGIIRNPSRIATLRVMSITGECVYATTNFMLESVQRLVEEDYTPANGFEENLLQLHGEKFKLFNFRMRMIHASNFDWRRQWDRAWKYILRGSQLALHKRRCYILEGTEEYGGYPLRYSDQKNASEEPSSVLTMTMFVTDNEPLPVMTRLVSKDGQEYFKWLGSKGSFTYSSRSLNLINNPPEYEDEDMNTYDEADTEIIADGVEIE